jgi:cytochrome P450
MAILSRVCHTTSLQQPTDIIAVKMFRYRWPKLARWIETTLAPKVESQIGQYVVDASKHEGHAKHTVAYKLRSSGKFSADQVAAECMNHLAAGIDTTGDALCFLIHKLSTSVGQQVQEKIIAEILTQFDSPIDELPYLEAVIKEGLRCFPPIPMSQPRVVPARGTIINGYSIPGGTIVSCQAWSAHRLNSAVFPDGDEFRPDRWLENSTTPEMNRLFFSFSVGGRACTGKQ